MAWTWSWTAFAVILALFAIVAQMFGGYFDPVETTRTGPSVDYRAKPHIAFAAALAAGAVYAAVLTALLGFVM